MCVSGVEQATLQTLARAIEKSDKRPAVLGKRASLRLDVDWSRWVVPSGDATERSR